MRCKRGRGGWEELPYTPFGGADARGIGLHDMVEAIAAGRPHRASGELGAHVVEVARGILLSAAEGRIVAISSRVDQPQPLPADALPLELPEVAPYTLSGTGESPLATIPAWLLAGQLDVVEVEDADVVRVGYEAEPRMAR